MRISDWSSDVCSSDLVALALDLELDLRGPSGSANPAQSAGREGGVCFFAPGFFAQAKKGGSRRQGAKAFDVDVAVVKDGEDQEQLAALAPLIRRCAPPSPRSEEHTSELQSLMRISYAVFCLKKNNKDRKK